jgi:hypothetical protein
MRGLDQVCHSCGSTTFHFIQGFWLANLRVALTSQTSKLTPKIIAKPSLHVSFTPESPLFGHFRDIAAVM